MGWLDFAPRRNLVELVQVLQDVAGSDVVDRPPCRPTHARMKTLHTVAASSRVGPVQPGHKALHRSGQLLANYLLQLHAYSSTAAGHTAARHRACHFDGGALLLDRQVAWAGCNAGWEIPSLGLNSNPAPSVGISHPCREDCCEGGSSPASASASASRPGQLTNTSACLPGGSSPSRHVSPKEERHAPVKRDSDAFGDGAEAR
eukprot:320427-Chlamydomonas_euryale.AAC.1